MLDVKICLLRPGSRMPVRGSAESAGLDVFANLKDPSWHEQKITLEPGDKATVPTGLAMAIPEGYAYLVCSRSGLAFKHGVLVPHAPGVIDSDYRGELMILLENTGKEPFVISHGDRIAQLVYIQHEVPRFFMVSKEGLGRTDRGDGGFGSSGSR